MPTGARVQLYDHIEDRNALEQRSRSLLAQILLRKYILRSKRACWVKTM